MTLYRELLEFKRERIKEEGRKQKTIYDYYYDLISNPDSIMDMPNEIIKKVVKEYELIVVGGDKDYQGIFIGKKRLIPRVSWIPILEVASDSGFRFSGNIGGKDIKLNKVVVPYGLNFKDLTDEHTLYITDLTCADASNLRCYIAGVDPVHYSVYFDSINYYLYSKETNFRK